MTDHPAPADTTRRDFLSTGLKLGAAVLVAPYVARAQQSAGKAALNVALIGCGYVVVHDGPFAFTDGEIAEVRWVTRAELGALMTRERFVPDNVALLLPLLDAR